MIEHQFATPVLIQNGSEAPLHRVEFADNLRSEEWIQQLLFKHPKLIPFEELQQAFQNSFAVAREVESGAGPIDLLYVNQDGFITLVETKLWRNPESRRKVVAQLIDYAAALSRMTYDELCEAIEDAGGEPLIKRVRQGDRDFDEKRFHDAVSRNLRLGRFLLLVVGDGIQEGAERMTEFLQCQPHLGFTLALVEMSLFRVSPDDDGTLLVQPRVVARTREIVRSIVEIHGTVDRMTVSTPPEEPSTNKQRQKLSEEKFLEDLAALDRPGLVKFARWVLDHAEEHKLTIDWGGAGPLLKYVHPDSGEFFTFGSLDRTGTLANTEWLSRRCRMLGLPDRIWRSYLEEIARLIPGATLGKYMDKKMKQEYEYIIVGDDEWPPLEPLISKKEQWFAAIDRAIEQVNKAMAKRS